MFSKHNIVFLHPMTTQVFKIWYILETDFTLIRGFLKLKIKYVISTQFKVLNCIWMAFNLPMEGFFLKFILSSKLCSQIKIRFSCNSLQKSSNQMVFHHSRDKSPYMLWKKPLWPVCSEDEEKEKKIIEELGWMGHLMVIQSNPPER